MPSVNAHPSDRVGCVQLLADAVTQRMASGGGDPRRTPPPCNPYEQPYRPRDVHWSEALTFAMTDPNQVFEEDEETVTIRDGYPKSRYHYLIVPRENIVSIVDLRSTHLRLLRHMHAIALDLISRVQAREPDREFRLGYHAVPSLRRLHLHVISQDFDSPRMRKKHQWNTFNTSFFIDSEEVMSTVEREGRVAINEQENEALLESRMKCNLCPALFDEINDLNRHRREVHNVAHSTAHSLYPPRRPSAGSHGDRAVRTSWGAHHHHHHHSTPYNRDRH